MTRQPIPQPAPASQRDKTPARSFATLFGLVAAVTLLSTVLASDPVRAQICGRPLCRIDENYTGGGVDEVGRYGICQGQSLFGTSHYQERCAPGRTLNLETGACILDACLGGCGGLAPLCDANERYTPGGDESDGVGVCSFGGFPPLLTRAHSPRQCREGWTLLEETGVCRRDCLFVTEVDTELELPRLLPDLIIRRVWLRSASGATVGAVPQGRPYNACFEVANEGSSASGAFHVAGGGLGVPTPPTQAHAPLAAGASREACLVYPATPQPGTFVLVIEADPFHAVNESGEGNNAAQLNVVVEP